MTNLIEINDFENMLIEHNCSTSQIREYIKKAKTLLKNNRKAEWEKLIKANADFWNISVNEAIEKTGMKFDEKEIEENEILNDVAQFYGITVETAKQRLNQTIIESKPTQTGLAKSSSGKERLLFGFKKYEYKNNDLKVVCYIVKWTDISDLSNLKFGQTTSSTAITPKISTLSEQDQKRYNTAELLDSGKIKIEQLLNFNFKDKNGNINCPVKIKISEGSVRDATIEDFRSVKDKSSEQQSAPSSPELKPEFYENPFSEAEISE